MINNAYQSLNNVLNQFTRAAGAAERVLSLLDMQPDIDPEGGVPVEQACYTYGCSLQPARLQPAARTVAVFSTHYCSLQHARCSLQRVRLACPAAQAVRKWDIAFEDVRFAYQMRPQQQARPPPRHLACCATHSPRPRASGLRSHAPGPACTPMRPACTPMRPACNPMRLASHLHASGLHLHSGAARSELYD